MIFLSKKTIYLDYAGATPIDARVARKMAKYKKGFFYNPSAIYEGGVEVRKVIEEIRGKIAKLINAHADEIIFTGSGTESVALAILGVINNYKLQNKKEDSNKKIPHLITTQIEHPAVLENFRLTEERGEAEVTYLTVDQNGIVDLKELKSSLKENTILVSIMYANNEIGTIQPIEEIAKTIRLFRKRGKEEKQGPFFGSSDEGGRGARPLKNDLVFPLFHTDACQAMNYLFTKNIEKLGVDMMSFNSSKIYGPKGIGALYKKRKAELAPLYSGGGQEFGLRSGTESVALIVGFAEALVITNKIKKEETERITEIRDYGIEKLLSLSDVSGYKIILNGSKENRLPNNINISVEGISSELLVIELSAKGISVSEKSACGSGDHNQSYVIESLRKSQNTDLKNFSGSLRITLGRQTKKGDIDSLVKSLKNILEKYKKFKK